MIDNILYLQDILYLIYMYCNYILYKHKYMLYLNILYINIDIT